MIAAGSVATLATDAEVAGLDRGGIARAAGVVTWQLRH